MPGRRDHSSGARRAAAVRQCAVGGCSSLRARHSAAWAVSAAASSSARSRRRAAIDPLLPRAADMRPSIRFASIIRGLRATKMSDSAFLVIAKSTPPIRNGASIGRTGKRGPCSASGSSGASSDSPA